MVKNPPADVRGPLDIDLLSASVSRLAGYTVAPGDVALVLMNSPMDDLYSKHGQRVYWDIWDKETPINGVPAKKVLSRSDFVGGEVYLIWIDDQLTILQPHMPEANAPVWADEVHEVAALHAAQIVDEFVARELIQLILAASQPPQPAGVTINQIEELLSTPRNRGRLPRGQ